MAEFLSTPCTEITPSTGNNDFNIFLVELGITTDENRTFAIKPDLRKLFFITDDAFSKWDNGFQSYSIGVYENLKGKFNFDIEIYFDGMQGNLYAPDRKHPYLNANQTFSAPFLQSQEVKSIKTLDIISCIDKGHNVYIDNHIGKNLTKIFKHFKVDENLIDSFIFASICLSFYTFVMFKRDNTEKPSNDEYKLYKAMNGFIKNPVIQDYPETVNEVSEIKQWVEIEEKVKNYEHQKQFRTGNSRSVEIERFKHNDTKRLFKALVYIFNRRNKVDLQIARKVGVYILAYFRFIQPFFNSKTFYQFFTSSDFSKMPIDDEPYI